MLDKANNKIKWTLGALTGLYFLIKFVAPLVIKALAQAQSVALLNIICSASGVQPVSYYVGMMENLIFGPIHMVLSAVIFLCVYWYYLKDVSLKKYFWAVFLFLFATKFEICFWPPYGDSASGPCAEAIWLARHNFDYVLLSKQASFIAGGPKVYLFSIYPTFLAVLMKLIPNVKLFLFVNHVIVLGLAAGIVALFKGITQKKLSADCAALSSMVLLFIPLFQSQAEQINMAVPMLFFAVLSAYYLVDKRVWLAVLMAIAAAMVKGVAIIICASVFVVCCGLCLFDKELKKKWSVLLAGCVAMGFVVLKYLAAFFVLNKDGKAGMVGWLMGWNSMKSAGIFHVFILVTVLLLAIFVWLMLKKKLSVRALFMQEYVMLVMFVYTCSWFALFVHSQGLQPRYWLLMAPFNLFGLIFVVMTFVRGEMLRMSILITAIIFGALCSYGLFYEPVLMNAHSAQERTLEYRNDLKAHLEMAKILEQRFSKFTIGAPFTFGHTLALRELGYVSQDLDILMYQFPNTYGIRTFKGLAQLDLYRTIWVGVRTETNLPKVFADNFQYPIAAEDQIVETIQVGDRRIDLFVGGVAIEKMRVLRIHMLRQMVQKGLLK